MLRRRALQGLGERAILAIVTTNLLRSPARTIATALGIAVGVAMIVALLSFTQGLKQTAAGFVHLGGSDLGIFQANVSDPTASLLPESLVGARRRAARRSAAHAAGADRRRPEVRPGAIVFGADPAGFFYRGLVLTAGRAPAAGAQQVLVGDRLAAQLICTPARALTISGHRFTVAGIYHSGILFEDSGAVLALPQAQALTGRPGEVTDIVVQLSAGTHGEQRRRPDRAGIPRHPGDLRSRSRRCAPARTARSSRRRSS